MFCEIVDALKFKIQSHFEVVGSTPISPQYFGLIMLVNCYNKYNNNCNGKLVDLFLINVCVIHTLISLDINVFRI
jgi:hypothetical protein